MRRTTGFLMIAAVTALSVTSLAGCGDTTPDEAAGDGARCAAGSGTTVTVEIPEFAFDPNPVEIAVCDSVVWKNVHTQAHTSTGNGDKVWSTNNIAPNAESEPVRFEETGSFAYICALHPFMKGTVEVT